MRCMLGAVLGAVAAESAAPHLSFILVDDLGYNDFAYQSSDLSEKWPKASRLAEHGIKIETYYTQPICTPTRGAFMSGRHPVRLGLQHGVIGGFQDYGLPLKEVTIADKLKSAGYRTYAVGKWHLGSYNFESTPTYRGFDTYFGYWNGAEDYETHVIANYLDFHRQEGTNHAQVSNETNVYSAFVFVEEMSNAITSHKKNYPSTPAFFYFPLQNVHVPLESPGGYYDSVCSGVPNSDRKTFCAMAAIADDAIGNVTHLMKETFFNEDYLVVIAGDNGGIPFGAGNNFPLRGHKGELFEGGIRNNAVMWGSLIPVALRGSTYNKGLIHVMDWHATFVALGGATDKAALDGYNVWPAISGSKESPRTEFLVNYDPCSGHGRCTGTEYAYRLGDMKLIVGQVNDTWYPVPTSEEGYSNPDLVHDASGGVWWKDDERYAAAAETMYLFNITSDPTEHVNLAGDASYKSVISSLTDKVNAIVKGDDYLAPCNIPGGSCDDSDPNGPTAAEAHGGWYPWVTSK